AFFQGTLGQFTAYSALGQLDRANQEPGAGRPYQPSAPTQNSETRTAEANNYSTGRVNSASHDSAESSGRMGKANV
ncbi:hypothetical protein VDF12_19520, partial [Xanthomonas campestris pv. raphani]|nr:hypothetical protein [Xanthomonas campestris pv. raphani]